MPLCLAPVIFAGYAMFLGVGPHNAGHGSAPMVEVQTCPDGVGAYANATTNGLYAGGLQYGWKLYEGPITVRLTPGLGVSYADHTVHNLPKHYQFDLKIGVSVEYQQFFSYVGYRHWSAGCALSFPCSSYEYQHNHGLDRGEIGFGYQFDLF